MKFTYFEVVDIDEAQGNIPGHEIANLICLALNGEGPYERGDYGWEWVFKGSNYKALAVLQQYENGWLIPVNVGFLDRLFKRGESVLEDMSRGIEKALGPKIKKIHKFKSEQEFNESNI